MKLETQEGLRLLENAENGLVSFDIESTSLKGDYGTPLCVSFKPYGEKPYTFSVDKVGNDKKLVQAVAAELSKYTCWMSYYGSLFDVKMLNTRLLKHGLPPLEKRLHIDLYFKLKNHLLINGKSLGNVGRFLKVGEEKMSVHQDVWAEMAYNMKEHMPVMIERCESDTILLEDVYDKTKHLIGGVERWK